MPRKKKADVNDDGIVDEKDVIEVINAIKEEKEEEKIIEEVIPVIIEDSKQLIYFKQFDNLLTESDIVHKGGNEYFCPKVKKGVSL